MLMFLAGVWLMWLASMAYHGLGGEEEELYGIAFNLQNTLERLLCCSGLLLRGCLSWCCCTDHQGGVTVGGGGECGVAALSWLTTVFVGLGFCGTGAWMEAGVSG